MNLWNMKKSFSYIHSTLFRNLESYIIILERF